MAGAMTSAAGYDANGYTSPLAYMLGNQQQSMNNSAALQAILEALGKK